MSRSPRISAHPRWPMPLFLSTRTVSVRCYPHLSTLRLGGAFWGIAKLTQALGWAGLERANLASSCATSPAAFDDAYAGRGPGVDQVDQQGRAGCQAVIACEPAYPACARV